MKYVALLLIRLYQLCISPLIGSCCRFSPSCSVYAVESFEKHGFIKGLKLTLSRIFKCHPWHPGGIDNVP